MIDILQLDDARRVTGTVMTEAHTNDWNTCDYIVDAGGYQIGLDRKVGAAPVIAHTFDEMVRKTTDLGDEAARVENRTADHVNMLALPCMSQLKYKDHQVAEEAATDQFRDRQQQLLDQSRQK